MRKSILIIATIAFSILNVNAINENKTSNTFNEVLEITKNNIAQVFEWKVETTKRTYSGTSLSLEQAKNMIALVSSGELITSKEITSYFVLRSEVNSTEKRNYFWEVNTATGSAKGYSSTLEYANKMIELVASGDAIVSKKIISQPQL
ncbi:hypothetical protein [Seonamhaeicola marinus]|uniref:Uncharacterized protein n=1 Tax=Seonamhaeicola marinus TaxID=1912246 RepID=A0A5D0HWI8_9FLAO|nr:hypothetical protein [Seonamhaeicola marinus]TYA74497.1 hypothetical protein FUA24_14330 [Seonamhaeicola marinus]